MRKQGNSNKTAIIVLLIFLIAFVIAAVIVILFLRTNNSPKYDNSIGEISYQLTTKDHIASTNSGIMYADNELLVVVKDGVTKRDVEHLAQKYDASIVGCIEATGDYQWVLEGVTSIDEIDALINILSMEDIVVQASPNYIFEISENSVDYNINTGKKWKSDLKNSSDNKGKSWGVEAINAPAAWKLMDNYKEQINPVRVGVIDSGFDDTHEDLHFSELFYNSAYNNAKKSKKKAIGEHGTHVTGTFAATGDNDEGICGIYPYAKEGGLYGAVWSNDEQYVENKVSLVWEKVCFAELILRNVKVINCSYGYTEFGAYMEYFRRVLQDNTAVNIYEDYVSNQGKLFGDFLERFIRKGYDFLVVVSAGNASNKRFELTVNGQKTTYTTGDVPARVNNSASFVSKDQNVDAYNRIIVVGAIDKKFNRCAFSNNGERVDVYAPGLDIYSTVPVSKYENGEKWKGTSMAAPHVAGVAASVWSMNNGFSGPVVKNVICQALKADHSDLPIIDMESAIQIALSTGQNATLNPEKLDSNNGSIMGFVVDKDNYSVTGDGIETGAVSGAEIKAINNENKQITFTETDFGGHFELFLSPGQYTLTVNAIGYEPYTWTETIKVNEGQVHYLKDWIKLTALDNLETDVTTTESNTGTTGTAHSRTYWVIFDEGFRNDRLELSTFTVEGDASKVYAVWNGNLIPYSDGGTVSSCRQYHYDADWVYDRDYRILSDKANRIYASNFNIYDSSGKLIISPSDSLADAQTKAIKEKENSLNQQNISQIVGIYKGQYTASQGDTGLTLSIYKTSEVIKSQSIQQRLADIATSCSKNSEGVPQKNYSSDEIKEIVQQHAGDYIAFFYYYPLASNPDVEDGLYTMTVNYDSSTERYSLVGEAWIQRDSYVFADLNDVYVDNGEMFGSWDLYAIKQVVSL